LGHSGKREAKEKGVDENGGRGENHWRYQRALPQIKAPATTKHLPSNGEGSDTEERQVDGGIARDLKMANAKIGCAAVNRT